MNIEFVSAANFLVYLVSHKFNKKEQERFRECLTRVICQRFRDHWFPNKPYAACGYRCLRIREDYFTPIIAQACGCAQISLDSVKKALPSNMMIWIDPYEVTYRIGDHGVIICLYEYKEDQVNVPWKAPPNLPVSKWYCCWT